MVSAWLRPDRQPASVWQNALAHEREAICCSVSRRADCLILEALLVGGWGAFSAFSKVHINGQQNSLSLSVPCGASPWRVIIKLRNNERRGEEAEVEIRRLREGGRRNPCQFDKPHQISTCAIGFSIKRRNWCVCVEVCVRVYTWRPVYMSKIT